MDSPVADINLDMVIDAINRKVHLEVDNDNFLTVDQNGNVGINNENPAVELDVNGDAHIEGALTIGPTQRILVVSATEFTNDSNINHVTSGGTAVLGVPRLTHISTGSDASGAAGFHLPGGAVIEKIEAHVLDTAPGGQDDVSLFLETAPFGSLAAVSISQLAIFKSAGALGEQILESNLTTPHPVDPENVYWIRVRLDDIDSGGSLFLNTVRITYTVASPLP